jgi:hypothetical protein
MKGSGACMPVQVRMQNRHITEADDPFGELPETVEPQAVDNAYKSISPASTKDRSQFLIIKHFLKIIETIFICTPECVVPLTDRLPEFHVKTPLT